MTGPGASRAMRAKTGGSLLPGCALVGALALAGPGGAALGVGGGRCATDEAGGLDEAGSISPAAFRGGVQALARRSSAIVSVRSDTPVTFAAMAADSSETAGSNQAKEPERTTPALDA
jgi:hypothetical protein